MLSSARMMHAAVHFASKVDHTHTSSELSRQGAIKIDD